MKNKQLIIIGGGTSIREGVKLRLWNKLDGRFTIGTNFSYQFFTSTIQCYVDKDFYNNEVNNISHLPMIIGKKHSLDKKNPNTIMIPASSEYKPRNIKDGIYKSSLVGLFALSLGLYLLDEGECYLLGFDYGNISNKKDKNNKLYTHFYQDQLKHRGIGKVNYYTMRGRADKDFGVYLPDSKIKIYNVSPNSKITVFPKLTYSEFFNKLNNIRYGQDNLRKYIVNKLQEQICIM